MKVVNLTLSRETIPDHPGGPHDDHKDSLKWEREAEVVAMMLFEKESTYHCWFQRWRKGSMSQGMWAAFTVIN